MSSASFGWWDPRQLGLSGERTRPNPDFTSSCLLSPDVTFPERTPSVSLLIRVAPGAASSYDPARTPRGAGAAGAAVKGTDTHSEEP